jgi:hypothetical protein
MSNLNEYEFNPELLNESYELELENLEGELAGELMSVSNEFEFENFLGNIWDAAKRLYNSPLGQALKKKFISGAKSFGRQMFPVVGKRLGGYLGGAAGSRLGGRLGGAAGSQLGGQLGGDAGSQLGGQLGDAAGDWLFGGGEEQEAVDYVRVIRKAANYLNKALSEGAAGSPRSMVTQALNQAARPILRKRRKSGYNSNYSLPKHGRWIRQGNRLIIQGVR